MTHLLHAHWWTPDGRPPMLAIPAWLVSGEEWAALDRAHETFAAWEDHRHAEEVARSGRPDPRLAGTVFQPHPNPVEALER